MNSTIPSIGILGFAHGHVASYLTAWRALPPDRIRLIAGWDHDSNRAAESCAKFNLAQASSADALLSRSDISAVVIAAETSLHADLVEKSAGAGKAIILQKPLALTLPQADRIVAAVESAGVPFTLAWQMRVDPQNLRMKQLISDGALGRILMIRRRHGLSTHTWKNFDQSWHVKPELNRGMWADDACHPIDFLNWLFGLPQTVSAEIATLLSPKVPDDHGIAIFRYPDGMFAEICSSFTCVAGENTTEIVGENGVVIQNFGDAVSCNLPRPADAPGLKWFAKDASAWTNFDIPTPKNHGERIAALAPILFDFLLGRAPAICTARQGRDSLLMTLASYRAAELGRRVSLSEMSQLPTA